MLTIKHKCLHHTIEFFYNKGKRDTRMFEYLCILCPKTHSPKQYTTPVT